MKTIRPDQDPAYEEPKMSTKTGAATVQINNSNPRSKLFSENEGFLTNGVGFIEIKLSDPPVLKPQTQTSIYFLIHRTHQSFSFPFERGELTRYT